MKKWHKMCVLKCGTVTVLAILGAKRHLFDNFCLILKVKPLKNGVK